MTSSEAEFYAAGLKIGNYVVNFGKDNISPKTLQALMGDLLPQYANQQDALRSIVVKSSFLQLLDFAGTGKGIVQRDCACTDGQQAEGCNSGGFALGLSPNGVFPILVGIHGMSEDYNGGEGRSGISLGIPIEGELLKYISSIAERNGISSGDLGIRDSISKSFYSI